MTKEASQSRWSLSHISNILTNKPLIEPAPASLGDMLELLSNQPTQKIVTSLAQPTSLSHLFLATDTDLNVKVEEAFLSARGATSTSPITKGM